LSGLLLAIFLNGRGIFSNFDIEKVTSKAKRSLKTVAMTLGWIPVILIFTWTFFRDPVVIRAFGAGVFIVYGMFFQNHLRFSKKPKEKVVVPKDWIDN